MQVKEALMCGTCDDFSETVEIRFPEQYHRLKEEIIPLLDSRKLRLLKGTCSLKDIKRESRWPADILEHDFQCTSCGRVFRLFVDTYHGRGSWSRRE
jgi:hypothetical protein